MIAVTTFLATALLVFVAIEFVCERLAIRRDRRIFHSALKRLSEEIA